DSGSIEQDADIVMFLYREDYYNKSSTRKNEADLIISKNRSGSTNNGLPFMFTGEYSRFTEKKDE
ncbi:MAG: DnaB-like helicase C-terminal domain-containing protein, partial [Anaeroplasmataceae bacterium]|nr:DnaB-like helicase C-terminal domain-containing protein [Anaeroplasmataceae bacterium]